MKARTRRTPHPAELIRAHALLIEETLYDIRHGALPFDAGEDRIHGLASDISTLAHDLQAVAPSLRIVTTIERAA
jgi:hypothetical protein